MTKDRKNFVTLTRRKILGCVGMAFAGAVAGPSVLGEPRPQGPIQSTPSPAKEPNEKRTFLHQEIHLHASPQRIYEVLLDSKQFAAFTGRPAEIDPSAGGAFLDVWKADHRTQCRTHPNRQV